jgi:hypothetical protein
MPYAYYKNTRQGIYALYHRPGDSGKNSTTRATIKKGLWRKKTIVLIHIEWIVFIYRRLV